MANATVSAVAARLNIGANQAAIAAAVGGVVVASDIAALGALLAAMAASAEGMIPLISLATTPANASTMLTPD